MVPFLVLAILEGHYRTAFVLFVAAGISDGLDGLLARWLSQRTTLGQYLDPVADKLLLSTLFLVLNHEGLISRRVTVLVFGRDLGILIVGAILFAGVGLRNFKPSVFGKANTLAQVIALTAVLLAQFEPTAPVLIVRSWALFATMGLTCVSGFDYAIRIAWRLGGGSPEAVAEALPAPTVESEAEAEQHTQV
jgi:cardiolipin synthase